MNHTDTGLLSLRLRGGGRAPVSPERPSRAETDTGAFSSLDAQAGDHLPDRADAGAGALHAVLQRDQLEPPAPRPTTDVHRPAELHRLLSGPGHRQDHAQYPCVLRRGRGPFPRPRDDPRSAPHPGVQGTEPGAHASDHPVSHHAHRVRCHVEEHAVQSRVRPDQLHSRGRSAVPGSTG